MTTAEAATDDAASRCRVSVAKPRVTGDARIVSSASRHGCRTGALLRVRIKRAVPGTDPVVKSGATRSGRLSLALPCAPGVYYAVATDYRGRTARSKAARLTCAPTSTPTPSASPTTPAPTPTNGGNGGTTGGAEENEVLRLTNAERAKGGCRPLAQDPQLHAAAAGHSANMAKQGRMDHTLDGRTFMDRIRAAGFTGGSAFAENIAYGQRTASDVVTAWMNSSGHRANIMNCAYTLIGVGLAKNGQGTPYWTQDFAAR